MENKRNKITLIIIAIMIVIFLVVFIVGISSEKDTRNNEAAPSATEETLQENTEPETENSRENTLTLSFIGDCILGSESGKIYDGNFSYMAENEDHTYFFSKVKDVLAQDDVTIANLECVLTDRDLEKEGKDYSPAFWFKAPTANADILTKGSVEVASLVNNHVYDYGDEGYEDTVAALKKENLLVAQTLKPLYIEKNSIKIGILSCHLWSSYNVSYIEDALEEMQDQCDYKIVFFHGGTEAVFQPDNYKIDACRYLASTGLCDLIVGSHPHVLQPMEVVDGVPILYSLGNFCYSASNYPDNKTVILRVNLSKTESGILTETELIPCYVYIGSINNYQPAIMTDSSDIAEVLDFMSSEVKHQKETEAPTTEAPVTEFVEIEEEEVIPEEETIPEEDDSYEVEDEEEFTGVAYAY